MNIFIWRYILRLYRNHFKRLKLLEQFSELPLQQQKALVLDHLSFQLNYSRSIVQVLEALLQNEKENARQLEKLCRECEEGNQAQEKSSVLKEWIEGR